MTHDRNVTVLLTGHTVSGGNVNGMDGQTGRVRRIMRPPAEEEGRIITIVTKPTQPISLQKPK